MILTSKQTILLASRDPDLQSTRSLVFRSAGFTTLLCTNLGSALMRAGNADLVLLGHTFEPREQDSFVEQVHETNPHLLMLCLRNGFVAPETLLDVCERLLSCQPAAPRSWMLEDGAVLPWAKSGEA